MRDGACSHPDQRRGTAQLSHMASCLLVRCCHRAGAIVEFAIVVRGVDAELDKLRDFVSGVVAGRMSERLAAEGAVAWTNRLTFLAHGLEHYPAGVLGRKDATFVPYTSCRHLQISDGMFKVFDLRSDKPIFSLKTSDENFFPGYLLLRRMVSLA